MLTFGGTWEPQRLPTIRGWGHFSRGIYFLVKLSSKSFNCKLRQNEIPVYPGKTNRIYVLACSINVVPCLAECNISTWQGLLRLAIKDSQPRPHSQQTSRSQDNSPDMTGQAPQSRQLTPLDGASSTTKTTSPNPWRRENLTAKTSVTPHARQQMITLVIVDMHKHVP